MLCVVAPFESVGGIRFGMPRAEAEEMGLEKNRMWERGKTWLRYSRDERVAAVGTVCAFSWVAKLFSYSVVFLFCCLFNHEYAF